ncbi:hypothetical protein ACEWY4_015984 [Coilia grayii]|uniref:Ig-like domain-containing protein n=1 Tax=Coilia grayii TaxID=363190 RepID=A0ABD1JQE5_9TELE
MYSCRLPLVWVPLSLANHPVGAMRVASALLMLTAGLIQGTFQTESICDTTTQKPALCYGRLGHTVQLKLTKITNVHYLTLQKNATQMFRFRKSKTTSVALSLQGRSKFIPENGTLEISSANPSDSGSYVTEAYDASGLDAGKFHFQLIIEAPVDTPVVRHWCDGDLNTNVTCFSSGDSPQYSWSLGSKPLSKADADFSTDSQTVLLKGNVTGELTCIVSNHISTKHVMKRIPSCYADSKSVTRTASTNVSPSPISTVGVIIEDGDQDMQWWIYYVIIPGSAALALVIILTVTVSVCMCKKRRRPRTAVNSAEEYSE